MDLAEKFVTDNRESLTLFINRYVRDLAAAEEIAIDAFAEFFCSRRWNGSSSMRTYLFTIGKSRAIDHLRRQSRLAARQIPLSEEVASLTEDEVFSKVFADERRRVLLSAVDMLPREMRAAVYLVYFEGMSYGDVAKVMKIKPKRVDNLLVRAKAELRKIIGEEGRELL